MRYASEFDLRSWGLQEERDKTRSEEVKEGKKTMARIKKEEEKQYKRLAAMNTPKEKPETRSQKAERLKRDGGEELHT